MECNRQIFFVILDRFLPFYLPPSTPMDKIQKKRKKTLENFIILQMFTINDSFGHFGPFFPLYSQKSKNFKKLKKSPGDIII